MINRGSNKLKLNTFINSSRGISKLSDFTYFNTNNNVRQYNITIKSLNNLKSLLIICFKTIKFGIKNKKNIDVLISILVS